VKNLAHSIAKRLLNVSKKDGADNTLVSMRYAAERLLYRIGQSEYAKKFILKGATLFLAWHGHSYRTTKDVDLLGFGKPDTEHLIAIFRELCLPDTSTIDGIVFLPESVRARTIQEQQDYPGIRINLRAMLAQVRIDDSKNGHEIMEIFSQLWKGGRTILMVTHDPAIAAFSKSTIRLLDGAVQDNGAVH